MHLAKLLRTGGNLLLLDEPTNDLDVDTLRALEEALLSFPGCAVIISHDRWFLDRVATHVLAFEGDSQVTLVRGQLRGLRGEPPRAPRRRGRSPAPDQLQAADPGIVRGMASFLHTCYRIGDIDRSVSFYEKLGFEERRRMPIGDEAINVFMGMPGDDPRAGADVQPRRRRPTSSAPATTTSRSASTTSTGRSRASPSEGIEPGEAALPSRRPDEGSRIAFVRDPDGYRVELIELARLRRRAPVAGGRRYPRIMGQRTEIFDLGQLRLSSGEGRRLDLEVPVDGVRLRGSALRGPRRQRGRAARRLAHDERLLAAAALRDRARRPVHALPGAGRARGRGRRARGRPAGRRRRACARRTWTARSSTSPPGRATRWRSRCRRRSSAATTASGCARCAARTSTRPRPDHAHEREPDPRWAALRELKLD